MSTITRLSERVGRPNDVAHWDLTAMDDREVYSVHDADDLYETRWLREAVYDDCPWTDDDAADLLGRDWEDTHAV